MEITTFVLGEMPEWSNGPDSKSGVLLAVPGVRIPFSPQTNEKSLINNVFIRDFSVKAIIARRQLTLHNKLLHQ